MEKSGAGRSIGRRLAGRGPVLFGAIVILLAVVGAVFAPALAPFDPNAQMFDGLTLEGAPLPPGGTYLLGTDLLGRDLLSRLLFGARTSLVIGIAANGTAVLIGALVGVTAGFFRGWIGAALMGFTDLMMAFPALLLAIVLAAIFQPSLWIVALVIAHGELGAGGAGHLHRDDGAGGAGVRAGDAGDGGVERAHPRAAHPAAPPADDDRLGDARHLDHGAARGDALLPRHRGAAADRLLGQHHLREPDLLPDARPGWSSFPGAAIVLLALAFNLVGDGLRDVLDPTQKGRG